MFKNLSISLKTALISSLVVSILLVLAAGLIISKESKLVGFVLGEYEAMVQQTFTKQADRSARELDQRYSVNAKVISGASGYFVYNFDSEGLFNALNSFMELPDILAITVNDGDNNPFVALWKLGSAVKTGSELDNSINLSSAGTLSEKISYDGENVGTATIYYTDKILTEQIETNKEELAVEVNALSSVVNKKINAEIFSQSFIFIGVVVVLIVTIILTLRFVVVTRLNNITKGLRDIAEGEGDLTERLTDNYDDEIGELCKWFNTFVEKIQDIIKDVSKGAKDLDIASGELAQVSEVMKTDSDQTSEKAGNVSRASDEMTDNMSSVAAAMEQASTNINMVASAVEEVNATINQIADNTNNAQQIAVTAVEQTKSASVQVDELGIAADSIGNVLESITDISEQVNLLALNATIEAARAGEAGKGFAVVANEIKELARQTADATSEIRERIEGIQQTTKGTVSHIEQITHVVEEVNDIVITIATAVEEQSAATNEIANNVMQANEGIGEVNQNVSQSSMAISSVSEEIDEVTTAAMQISSNSAQVSISAEKLSGLSHHLNNMVGKFKV